MSRCENKMHNFFLSVTQEVLNLSETGTRLKHIFCFGLGVWGALIAFCLFFFCFSQPTAMICYVWRWYHAHIQIPTGGYVLRVKFPYAKAPPWMFLPGFFPVAAAGCWPAGGQQDTALAAGSSTSLLPASRKSRPFSRPFHTFCWAHTAFVSGSFIVVD